MVEPLVTHKDVSIAPYHGQAVARLNGKEIMSSREPSFYGKVRPLR